MNRVLAYLGRFAVIIFGFFCASAAASAFLHLLLLGFFDGGEADPNVLSYFFTHIALISFPFTTGVVAYLAFLPAVPIILLAEVMGWRNWLAFAAAGGIVAVAAVVLLNAGSAPHGQVRAPGLLASFIGAGLVGGIAYWCVAGRNAGIWLHRENGAIVPAP